MNQLTFQQNKDKIYYALRIASAMCFIGHGTFGIITKEIWCNYFAVFGIGHNLAYQLMPVLGIADILFGLSLLVYPTRLVLGWLVVWGLTTALLRPLSGEHFAEFIERAGNYGAPLALILLCRNSINNNNWLTKVTTDFTIDKQTLKGVTICLRIVVFMLLIGHGWLNLVEKKGIMGQYASLGFSDTANVAHIVGLFEVFAAGMALIKPIRPVLFAFLIWKMGSELFYPHWELFEWVERGGSYGAILALWFALPPAKASIHRKVLTAKIFKLLIIKTATINKTTS
jgi:hypothetical protein